MAFNVSGLSQYVKENNELLIRQMVLGDEGGYTVEKLRRQVGVKTKERLHYLDVNPSLQAVSGCGFSADGSTTISEREIETAQAKYNDEWCEEDLLGKYAEVEVAIKAGEERLPWEAEIMNGVVRGINKEVEKQIWIGDKSNTGRTDLINGFITIALGADSASTITGTTASGSSAYQLVKDTLNAIPEEIMDDAVIFVSPAIFREYIQDLVSANLYHFDPANGDFSEMFIPGSNVKVRKTYGLKGTSYAYASTYDNMVYGCDMINAKEELKVWFSDDNDVTRAKARFNFGVNTLYPDAVVLFSRG